MLLTAITVAFMMLTGDYSALHENMQHENRQYSAISNIMKTKHETVKNTLNNVR